MLSMNLNKISKEQIRQERLIIQINNMSNKHINLESKNQMILKRRQKIQAPSPKTVTKLSQWPQIVQETSLSANSRSAKFKRTMLRMRKRRLITLLRKTGMACLPLPQQRANRRIRRLGKVRAKRATPRSLRRPICASRPCRRRSCRRRSAGSKTWPKRTRKIKISTCRMDAAAASVTMRKGPNVSTQST